ncbi:hypothetical protein ABZ322_43700 [Streptomyces sp. NPDC006129]|uniref:hypothetical protein n=1 Tax=unclassified Streptomyces TaxID=2593676 RepID=UPI0033B26CC3
MFDERKEAEMRLYSERLARELAVKKQSEENAENAENAEGVENAENSETLSGAN